jgi:single-strand DNA-binding protein
MNRVILSGRLTKDAEIRYTQTNEKVASFTLAVDRIGSEEADFINCTAFKKTAEFIEKYLSKGRKILALGRININSYEKDGKKVYTTNVIVEQVEFADSKPNNVVQEDGLNKEVENGQAEALWQGDELPF